ncbi:hypothetical protein OnM2_04304 [Erysiphe neolycopersici]|uniref:Uncharacterized protein n=1 Tax=Erysiphe neolycopersici TaxID=212602 RepID=A0A420HU08_9PEZI|nr:hypothetical protein OnM2_04304 [Erysiphe neolycopersici]
MFQTAHFFVWTIILVRAFGSLLKTLPVVAFLQVGRLLDSGCKGCLGYQYFFQSQMVYAA